MVPINIAPHLKSTRFSSLEELDEWIVNHHVDLFDKFRISRESLSNYKRKKTVSTETENVPKVIVCHDYKGNYLVNEDDSPLGYFPHEDGYHYFLQFPSLVDMFIYFSHNKISVPPVSWTNTLHRQGILSLGTVIFEGVHDEKNLEAFVERTSDGHFKYVKYLVELTKHYGFDGWLINIETRFFYHEKAQELVRLVESLKSELHIFNPDSKVIWYDSFVTSVNRVAYQNGVNELNYDFFEASDLFFSNYWWDEKTLRENILNVGVQGIKKKLFVGVDVWGRGSKIGSGGFETGLAMKFIKLYSSNIGLFAPAWTYENFDKEEFVINDQQFWTDAVTSPNHNGSVSTYVQPFSTPVYENEGDVIFYTNFSQGEGNKFCVYGQTVFEKNWVNVGLQQYTPSLLRYKHLDITKEDAFNCGSSLKVTIQKSVEDSSKTNILPLFEFQKDLVSRNLNVSVSFKYVNEAVKTDLSLTLEITYSIERRYKSITKVREGVFRVPLTVEQCWKSLDTSFPLPRLQVREHFVLEGCRINWVPKEVNEFNENQSYETSEQSWIVVSGYNDLNMKYEFLLGDLLVEGIDSTSKDIPAVKKVNVEQLSDDNDQIICNWTDDKLVLYWLVYVNATFVGTSCTPSWILRKTDRIRVDCVSRSGKITRGNDLFV